MLPAGSRSHHRNCGPTWSFHTLPEGASSTWTPLVRPRGQASACSAPQMAPIVNRPRLTQPCPPRPQGTAQDLAGAGTHHKPVPLSAQPHGPDVCD